MEGPESLRLFDPVMVDLIRQAGLEPQSSQVPYARLIADLTQGKPDIAYFLSQASLDQLPLYQPIPVVLYRNEYVAVTIDPEIRITKPADLGQYSVAFPRGYASLSPVTKGLSNATEVTDEDQGFKMLGAGRVQVMLCSRTSVEIFGPAARHPLFVQEPALVSQPLYLVIRKTKAAEADALTRVLQAVLNDGTWAREREKVFKAMAAGS
jgi:ABC-type amino acid transport substrate-binding protein